MLCAGLLKSMFHNCREHINIFKELEVRWRSLSRNAWPSPWSWCNRSQVPTLSTNNSWDLRMLLSSNVDHVDQVFISLPIVCAEHLNSAYAFRGRAKVFVGHLSIHHFLCRIWSSWINCCRFLVHFDVFAAAFSVWLFCFWRWIPRRTSPRRWSLLEVVQ